MNAIAIKLKINIFTLFTQSMILKLECPLLKPQAALGLQFNQNGHKSPTIGPNRSSASVRLLQSGVIQQPKAQKRSSSPAILYSGTGTGSGSGYPKKTTLGKKEPHAKYVGFDIKIY